VRSMWERELAVAITAARDAGAVIRDLYDRAAAASYTKGDGSPVTDADLAADRIIRHHLATQFPRDAILTEEGADDLARLNVSRCWVVDPIDGTQQFIERTGEFDVLIALVVDGLPVVGAVYQPTTDTLLVAASGEGAWIERAGERKPLHLDAIPANQPPRLMTSYWFGAPDNLPLLQRAADRLGSGGPVTTPLGVTVRRFIPPDHSADALVGYYVNGRESMAWEWDFAASEIVVREAGGIVSDVWGRRHRYNKANPRNFGGIVLSVDPETHRRVLDALAPEVGELPVPN
jgi:3'(2'), 5'-bisphosphate nucleotidase